MNLKEYFAEVESPSANSPVGKLMEKLINKNPCMGFEEANKVRLRKLSE